MGSLQPATMLVGVAEVASNWSDCPRLNLRRDIRVGARNIRMIDCHYCRRELKQLRVEVAALSEVKIVQ